MKHLGVAEASTNPKIWQCPSKPEFIKSPLADPSGYVAEASMNSKTSRCASKQEVTIGRTLAGGRTTQRPEERFKDLAVPKQTKDLAEPKLTSKLEERFKDMPAPKRTSEAGRTIQRVSGAKS